MPMLDLLIHVASASKIPPSNHALQVHDDKKRVLEFKPSTPIGKKIAHFYFLRVSFPFWPLTVEREKQSLLCDLKVVNG